MQVVMQVLLRYMLISAVAAYRSLISCDAAAQLLQLVVLLNCAQKQLPM
jgi:hypothetical protein